MSVLGRTSFVLFKINDGNAGLAFAEGAETVGFNVTAFFQFIVDGGT